MGLGHALRVLDKRRGGPSLRAIGDWAPDVGRFDSSWSVLSSTVSSHIRFIDILEWRHDSTPDYPFSFAVWRDFGDGIEHFVESELWDPVGSNPPVVQGDASDEGDYELLDLDPDHTVLVTRGVDGVLDPRILDRILSVQEALERELRVVDYSCELELRCGRYSKVLFSLEVVLIVTDGISGEQRRITVGRREDGDWFTPHAANLQGADRGWRELLHLDGENFRDEALTESISVTLGLEWIEPLSALWDSRLPLRHEDFAGFEQLGTEPVRPGELPAVFTLLARSINALGVEGEEPSVALGESILAAQAVEFPARATLVDPVAVLGGLCEIFAQVSPSELNEALLNTYELSDDAIRVDDEFAWASWTIAFSGMEFGDNVVTGEGLCFSVFATDYQDYRTAEFFFDTEADAVYATPDPSGAYATRVEESPEIPGTRWWTPDRHSDDTGLFEVWIAREQSPRIAFAAVLRALHSLGFHHRKIRLKLLKEIVAPDNTTSSARFA